MASRKAQTCSTSPSKTSGRKGAAVLESIGTVLSTFSGRPTAQLDDAPAAALPSVSR